MELKLFANAATLLSASSSLRTDLKLVRDCWFHLLLLCTAIVALGVILEEADHLLPEGKPQLDMTRGIFTSSPLLQWKKRITRLGWLLIIVGVIGEGIFEGAVSTADGMLQDFNGTLLQIAEEQAGKASVSAKRAEDAAAKADKAAGEAQQRADQASAAAAGANRLAKSARRETARLTKESAELAKNLSAAETKLETVDAKRAELEKSLEYLAICSAPRVIPLWVVDNAGKIKTTADPLKPFARQVEIEYMPFDAEARRAASNIDLALKSAGWTITKLAPVNGIEDGVEVEPFVAPLHEPTDEWHALWQAEIRSREAADAVIDFLHSYNWQASRGWPQDEKGALIRDPKLFPPDNLRIRIGLYPAVIYISPPGAKDLTEVVAKFNQKTEEKRRQMEIERAKRDEELFKNLTAQQVMEYKARTKEWDEKEKVYLRRYSGPCQPLTSLAPSF